MIMIGDLNQEEKNTNIKDCVVDFGLTSIVKDKTCLKNSNNPRCMEDFYMDLQA